MAAINVNVRVQNNFPVTATKIQLWHQFSSNAVQSFTWSNVPSNGGSTSYATVQGSTSSGHDYWQILVMLNDSSVWEHTSSWKTCTIESSDQETYDTQVVSPNYWAIPLVSGGCTTWLQQVGSAAADAVREPESKKAAGTSQSNPAPGR